MLTTNLSLTLCHNYDTLTSTGEGTPSMAKKSNFGEDSPAEEEVKAAGETGKMFWDFGHNVDCFHCYVQFENIVLP